MIYKASVAVTMADLSVHAKALTACCVPALQRLVFDAVSEVEVAYGMGIPSTRCVTLLREYLWALRGDESSLPAMCTKEMSLTRIS
jgi:hypothetical protein